jgi:hypothetical protein
VYVQPEDLPQKRRRNRSKEDIEVSQLSMVLKFFSFIQQPEDLPQKRRRNRSKEDIEVSQLSMVLKFFSFIQQLIL